MRLACRHQPPHHGAVALARPFGRAGNGVRPVRPTAASTVDARPGDSRRLRHRLRPERRKSATLTARVQLGLSVGTSRSQVRQGTLRLLTWTLPGEGRAPHLPLIMLVCCQLPQRVANVTCGPRPRGVAALVRRWVTPATTSSPLPPALSQRVGEGVGPLTGRRCGLPVRTIEMNKHSERRCSG